MITRDLEQLKKAYYEDELSLEELKSQFDDLNLDCTNYIIHEKAVSIEDNHYMPYLFYDYKKEPKILVFLLRDIYIEENAKIIESAIKEYYEFSYFYDEITGLRPIDLVRIVIEKNNISAAYVIDLFHDTVKQKASIAYEEKKGENYS